MVYSDTTTKLGLIQDCEQLIFNAYGDISGNADRLYDFTARINRAYDKVSAKIMGADGRWQFDDTTYTDLPIGSTDLVSGQGDYKFDVEHLEITKLLIWDSRGNKTVLTPVGLDDPIARLMVEDTSTTGGIPEYYLKRGASIFLYPKPNYTTTNYSGITVYYQRRPNYFAYTDTTAKSPGIPAIFHRYLSLEASRDWAVSKLMPVKNDWLLELRELNDSIVDFYSKRSKDEQKIIRPVLRSSR